MCVFMYAQLLPRQLLSGFLNVFLFMLFIYLLSKFDAKTKGNVEATYLSRRMWLGTDFKG